ncbi:hypothetical protein PV10_02456 [Exophiala mesophila]|uniref:Uncharacterized protein n=1 Tax=Exophiala mesophila TaxID=212818 RepID=A0A0D2A6S4_EXOME|nr:uncharacterized protein PV10_02456 [Exophiala mesophila]KIV94718.1 hypothetical protein PV10_02456 [Exophiala mesophila]
MIPWATIQGSTSNLDFRGELNDYNLIHHVEYGPTQFIRGLHSSMLELAHERQFAVCQLGLSSVGFELEHTTRISDTLDLILKALNLHLAAGHHLEKAGRPASPHRDDVINCRPFGADPSGLSRALSPGLELEPETGLCIESCLDYEQRPQPDHPTSRMNQSCRSILDIQNLVNPMAQEPKPLKRKFSATITHPTIDADEEHLSKHMPPDEELELHNLLKFKRALRSSNPSAARINKIPRQRLQNPFQAASDIPHKTSMSTKACPEDLLALRHSKSGESAILASAITTRSTPSFNT